MKSSEPTELGRALVKFFHEYLPKQKGGSAHTVRSYRDALVLLLQFTARDTRRGIERLQITDLNAERIKRFLNFLEAERHNSIATRNARLAAIHVFARYLVNERPDCLGTLQPVIGIEFKRGGQIAPIEYLETHEIDALLRSIDRRVRMVSAITRSSP
jgi:integrase/recombinase XerD